MSDLEEGEIDSEEDSLRRRIGELEAENAECEKRMSEDYYDGGSNLLYTYDDFCNSDVQRAGRVPTDVSSISSTELSFSKKRKRKRSRKTGHKSRGKYSENNNPCHSHSHHKRHKYNRHNSKKRDACRHIFNRNKNEIETILLDSSDSDEFERDLTHRDNVGLPLRREELRLAVVRNPKDDAPKKICPLKDRLYRKKGSANSNVPKIKTCEIDAESKADDDFEKVSRNTSPDNSTTLEEQELRLIALRSAIMKKHLTRKKRNAEVAYSPTDFEQYVIDPVSSVESDLEELDKEINISPASSPLLSLSPIHCEDNITVVSLDSAESNVDSKPIDMDIVTSESDNEECLLNEFSNKNMSQYYSDIPFPQESCTSTSYTPFKSPLELHHPLLSKKENMPDEKLSTHTSDCSMHNEKKAAICDNALNTADHTTSNQQNINVSATLVSEVDQTSDEEEKALRALLLSQRQNMKSSRQLLSTEIEKRKRSPYITPTFCQNERANDNSTPTESILKEAVRRLKFKTISTIYPSSDIDKACETQNSKLVAQITDNVHSPKNESLDNQLQSFKNSDKAKLRKTNMDKTNQQTSRLDLGKIVSETNENTNIETENLNSKESTNKINVINECKEITNELYISNGAHILNEKNNNVYNDESAVSYITNTDNQPTSIQPIIKDADVASANELKTNSTSYFGSNSVKNIPNKIGFSKASHAIKIIKPNKVINTHARLNEKVEITNEHTIKNPIALKSKSNAIATPWAITSTNLSDIKVKKLIISLNDSESSNDEEVLRNENLEKSIQKFTERTDTPQSLVTVLSENFYNIPCSNKSTFHEYQGSKTNNSAFEKKLEIFLKSVRSTVQERNKLDRTKNRRISSNETTPMAVRSLPIASQEEYKRLIQRMQLLEKQKQHKKLHKESGKNAGISSSSRPRENNELFAIEKQNLIPNDISKDQELQNFEASYVNISNRILSNLIKSLGLVSEVKRAKIEKLRCAQRLKELRLEMESTQRKLKEKEDKISKISPEICSTNDIITKLKKKQTNIFESTLKLGKSIKGNDYKLNNGLKKEIILKTKGLAADIRLVNSISYGDLDIFEKELDIVNKSEANCDSHECNELYCSTYKEGTKLNTDITVTDKNKNYIEKDDQSENLCNNFDKEASKVHCEPTMCEPLIHKEATEKPDLQNEELKESYAEDLKDDKDQEGCGEKESFTFRGDSEAFEEQKSPCKYVSPLMHLRTESGLWDPNGIVCPYELMGECNDKDCNYLHLCGRGSKLNNKIK